MHPELEREFGLGMTSPRDMATLFALIAEGKVVNRAISDEMSRSSIASRIAP